MKTLTALDRCDRCGAQAYTTWWKHVTKRLLMLCAHHAREHTPALEQQLFELTIDERDELAKAVRQPEPA